MALISPVTTNVSYVPFCSKKRTVVSSVFGKQFSNIILNSASLICGAILLITSSTATLTNARSGRANEFEFQHISRIKKKT